jgi:hypothetical protein
VSAPIRSRPVTWSPAATQIVQAMRRRQQDNESISTRAALYAWMQDPLPGSSALARALRDETIWPDYVMVLNADIERRPVPGGGNSRQMTRWEYDSEKRARLDGSFRVGERHLLEQIEERELRELGIDVPALRATVRELELGPALPVEELAKWRHGLLDVSALIEYRKPDEIPWSAEMGGGPVMLWLVGSVLNELDDVKLSDRKRARKRAGARSSWIWGLLDDALGDTGAEIRKVDGTRVKAWLPPASGLRDTDHLESALALRALGVDVTIVSDDLNMSARGKMAGLRVIRLDRWRLPDDEEGPAT